MDLKRSLDKKGVWATMHILEQYPADGSRTFGMCVIDATSEATTKFGHAYGSELLVVGEGDVSALLSGKAWAFPVNGGEYVHFVVLAPNDTSQASPSKQGVEEAV